MLGVSGRVLRSAGGGFVPPTSETLVENIAGVGLTAIATDDSTMVAVGDADGTDAAIYTSTDGSTWTERSNPKNVRLWAIAYHDGLWVAVGEADGTDAYIITATDPTGTWTERSNPANITLRAVNYVNGKWVAGGLRNGSQGAYVIESSDAITWTDRTVASQNTLQECYSIAYDGTYYLLAGNRWLTILAGSGMVRTTNLTSYDSGYGTNRNNSKNWAVNVDPTGSYIDLVTSGGTDGVLSYGPAPVGAPAFTTYVTDAANSFAHTNIVYWDGYVLSADGNKLYWTSDRSTVSTLTLSSKYHYGLVLFGNVLYVVGRVFNVSVWDGKIYKIT